MKNRDHGRRLGLVLSGGGARALAHIGVLKVLQREGIEVECIVGSSMGGVIAAALAAGISPAEMEAEALRMSRTRNLIRLIDLRPPRRGLLTGKRLRAYLSEMLGEERNFESLTMPLALTAVDLRSGREITLSEGSVIEAVLATCAFPGILPPVEKDERRLVDGGLLNNLPVDLARQLEADLVIAVDVGYRREEDVPSKRPDGISFIPGFAYYTYQAALIMNSALTKARLEDSPPDLLLRPCIPADIGLFTGFTRAAEIIAAGERAATKRLRKLRRIENSLLRAA